MQSNEIACWCGGDAKLRGVDQISATRSKYFIRPLACGHGEFVITCAALEIKTIMETFSANTAPIANLLPCPFCAKPAEQPVDFGETYEIECDCGRAFCAGPTPQAAADRWNERAEASE